MKDIEEYFLRLDPQLTSDYQAFRSKTSTPYTYNNQTYPVVHLSSSDFAKLTVQHEGESKLTLIVNLQDYYVFGFLIKGLCYAFKGVEIKLQEAGFDVKEVIPYGDAYFDIGTPEVERQVRGEVVSAEIILSSIDFITTMENSWDQKREHLLRVFWALVEGVRFSGISDVVQSLFDPPTNVTESTVTYDYFFYMAERWEKISVGNAYLGKLDSSVAVYALRPLENRNYDET